MGNAVRKFISRFLVGERFNRIESNIFTFIKEKNELWDEEIKSVENEEQFKKEIDKLDSINILINQSVDFYEKLGGERAEERKNNSNESIRKKDKMKKKNKKQKKGFGLLISLYNNKYYKYITNIFLNNFLREK